MTDTSSQDQQINHQDNHQDNYQNNHQNSQEDSHPDMRIDPTRASTLSTALTTTLTRITHATPPSHPPPRLIAVSKLKPASDILSLHSPPTSHLHFGENYYQELLTKSLLLPPTIRWHFIGALQTNKCRPLASQVPNLWCVESVDTRKKAEGLNKGRGALREEEREGNREIRRAERERELRVCVQVNTSGESEKAGVEPDGAEVVELCRFIREECRFLTLQGLMTIGALARSRASEEGVENEDFVKLKEVRDRVVEELGMQRGDLELSMGMSEDFESAIRCGSDEVRVGSTIFGERPPKKEAQI